jgi:hypothetical protein
LHDPALLPFFAFMASQQRPIWMHPYYNSADGKGNARETIASVNALPMPPAQKAHILGDNLCQLLGL